MQLPRSNGDQQLQMAHGGGKSSYSLSPPTAAWFGFPKSISHQFDCIPLLFPMFLRERRSAQMIVGARSAQFWTMLIWGVLPSFSFIKLVALRLGIVLAVLVLVIGNNYMGWHHFWLGCMWCNHRLWWHHFWCILWTDLGQPGSPAHTYSLF